ncbi:hypothetical protein DESPIGER_1329 [Desulfovibrio piger]|uniref:Uncharacterized protein n=1 Tax=Desulfovibrio piger TaxID=901 RepID=A0A1K1LEP7_9BACT|nr:hypothetical protein DESPIGER_1329 [Desulfovibrio piger]
MPGHPHRIRHPPRSRRTKIVSFRGRGTDALSRGPGIMGAQPCPHA